MEIKPKIGTYIPQELENDEWGICNRLTGAMLLHEDGRTAVYPKQWALQKCKELNEKD